MCNIQYQEILSTSSVLIYNVSSYLYMKYIFISALLTTFFEEMPFFVV